MNNLKLRIFWYMDFLINSKFYFFVMLFFVVFWVILSNFYIKEKYIDIISGYENLIDSKTIEIKDQSFFKAKKIDLYSLVVSSTEKNSIEIKSYVMNKKSFVFSLLGSENEIKNFLFDINGLSSENKFNISKVDLSFEETNKTGLVLEIQSYDK